MLIELADKQSYIDAYTHNGNYRHTHTHIGEIQYNNHFFRTNNDYIFREKVVQNLVLHNIFQNLHGVSFL